MAYTQSDIDDLKAAIASGALRVRYADGREIQYRSLAEMRETLGIMQAEATGTTSSSSRSFLVGF